MGWQKKGRDYNSSTGHGAAMGLATGKVVSYLKEFQVSSFYCFTLFSEKLINIVYKIAD